MLKIKGRTKLYLANAIKKKAGVAIFTSNKIIQHKEL